MHARISAEPSTEHSCGARASRAGSRLLYMHAPASVCRLTSWRYESACATSAATMSRCVALKVTARCGSPRSDARLPPPMCSYTRQGVCSQSRRHARRKWHPAKHAPASSDHSADPPCAWLRFPMLTALYPPLSSRAKRTGSRCMRVRGWFTWPMLTPSSRTIRSCCHSHRRSASFSNSLRPCPTPDSPTFVPTLAARLRAKRTPAMDSGFRFPGFGLRLRAEGLVAGFEVEG